MNPGNRLRSRIVNIVLSARYRRLKRSFSEWRRRLTGSPHRVTVFLELDDPYSYLLSHYLDELARVYRVELDIRLTEAVIDGFRPRPDMLAEYAIRDCARVAAELGIPFLDKGASPPVELRRALLAELAADDVDREELLGALALYWRGDAENVRRRAADAAGYDQAVGFLRKNQALLGKLGHYNSAMLHYGGEWYWGVDRISYLLERLDALGLRRPDEASARLASIRQAMTVRLPVRPPATASTLPPVELFYSLRSPYSYLALPRVADIAEAFGVTLELKPVLPMVMRGLPVPHRKILYIVFDAKREAERHRMPFGHVADPTGAGVERGLAVWTYAASEKRGFDFLVAAGRATWADAIDIATDAGMRRVADRAGLFWPEVAATMQGDDWRAEIEANRETMEEAGCWGVPTIRCGDFVAWGQDRDWLLARHLEELCDTGEGILV